MCIRDRVKTSAGRLSRAPRISAAIASTSSRSMTVRRTRPPSPVTLRHSQFVLVSRTSPMSYTHLRAHETPEHLVCRLLLEKKKKNDNKGIYNINDPKSIIIDKMYKFSA